MPRCHVVLLLLMFASTGTILSAQSSSSRPAKKTAPHAPAALDPGTVTNNVYRNKTLALSYKIPEGWVLRTDELNTHEEDKSSPDAPQTASSAGSQVLLAAFSRPPEAKGEDVNSSILIAAEPQSSYPGLKEALQYFGPLTEVAKAQGFTQDKELYEIAIGTKALARADYHRDMGTRVMHQSTLAMLSHGYAVSITAIAGTQDQVQDLIDGLSFAPAR